LPSFSLMDSLSSLLRCSRCWLPNGIKKQLLIIEECL
ncbi:unnamed protein product, partial [Tetraodon nigroviridis]